MFISGEWENMRMEWREEEKSGEEWDEEGSGKEEGFIDVEYMCERRNGESELLERNVGKGGGGRME